MYCILQVVQLFYNYCKCVRRCRPPTVFYSSFWHQLILAVDATPIQSHTVTTTVGDTVRLTKARAYVVYTFFHFCFLSRSSRSYESKHVRLFLYEK